MASIKDAHEVASDSRKPLILLTFSPWHLFRLYNTKTKALRKKCFLFLERCVPQVERDAHFVLDDGFAL